MELGARPAMALPLKRLIHLSTVRLDYCRPDSDSTAGKREHSPGKDTPLPGRASRNRSKKKRGGDRGQTQRPHLDRSPKRKMCLIG